MIDIVSFLPGKRKRAASGWISFNAPCCVHRGENQDKRMRGGIKLDGNDWNFHCFNCGFTASFTLGRTLSFKAKNLLKWLNVDEAVIDEINLESLKHRSVHGLLENNKHIAKVKIEFQKKDLPSDLELLNISPGHEKFRNYLSQRKIDWQQYPFMISPAASGRNSERIVIPFTHNNVIIGHCARFLDNKTPKYINDLQHGYVFGTDLQRDAWQYVLVMEGIFDALSINGLAVLHNDINTNQVEMIKQLNKEVIVIPDQDKAGLKLVDRAIELNWAVSMPEWPEDIKDVNDAVIKYGRLATLLMIIEAKTTNKIKIEIRKNEIGKRV